MGIFSAILDKLVHHASAAPTQPQAGGGQSQGGQQEARQAPSTGQQGQPGATPAPTQATGQNSLQNVDVEAVLSQLAAKKGGGGNWRSSIVDLLKLLDLDSSLDARKKLAAELDVHAGADGSAEENIALHKAVMSKVAENGGKVPDSMKR